MQRMNTCITRGTGRSSKVVFYDVTNFFCKSRIVNRTVVLPDKTKRKIREKVVVYWSKSFYERECHENASFLSFVEKLKANPGGFGITAVQSQSLRRFSRKDVLDRKTGNVLDGTKLAAMIDEEKLSEFNALFGYYQIVTPELDMSNREIIDKYHGLTQIEDQFREMKSTPFPPFGISAGRVRRLHDAYVI